MVVSRKMAVPQVVELMEDEIEIVVTELTVRSTICKVDAR